MITMAGSIFENENYLYSQIGKDECFNQENKTIEKRSEVVGRILTNLRMKRGYTQDELSKAIGIARQTYAGYERGKHEPSIEILIRIAEVYGISLDILTGRYSNTKHDFIKERIIEEYVEQEERKNEEIEEIIELKEHRKRAAYNRAKKSTP